MSWSETQGLFCKGLEWPFKYSTNCDFYTKAVKLLITIHLFFSPFFCQTLSVLKKKRKSTLLKIVKKKINMVDIVPNSQEIVGHGSFSIVYKARLEAVSKYSLIFLRRLLTFIVAHCARKPLKTIFDVNWHNEMLLKHFHYVF